MILDLIWNFKLGLDVETRKLQLTYDTPELSEIVRLYMMIIKYNPTISFDVDKDIQEMLDYLFYYIAIDDSCTENILSINNVLLDFSEISKLDINEYVNMFLQLLNQDITFVLIEFYKNIIKNNNDFNKKLKYLLRNRLNLSIKKTNEIISTYQDDSIIKHIKSNI